MKCFCTISTWVFGWTLNWTGQTTQMHFTGRETGVFWSAGPLPGTCFHLCCGISRFLRSGLLGQRHLDCWQEGDLTNWLRGPALSWDEPSTPVQVEGERRMFAKILSLMENDSHRLQRQAGHAGRLRRALMNGCCSLTHFQLCNFSIPMCTDAIVSYVYV